jgi:hypothetical protein
MRRLVSFIFTLRFRCFRHRHFLGRLCFGCHWVLWRRFRCYSSHCCRLYLWQFQLLDHVGQLGVVAMKLRLGVCVWRLYWRLFWTWLYILKNWLIAYILW